MTISIRIDPDAFDTGQPLDPFKLRDNPPLASQLQFPQAPLPLGTTGIQGAPGPGFIASASPLTLRTNINEDDTFPPEIVGSPPGATGEAGTEEILPNVIVHVSPTSGSTIIRGNNFLESKAESDPAYGLNIGVSPITLNESVFETAINDPIGGQFLANLQDLVARGIIEVADDGVVLTPEEIRDFVAT